MLRLILGGVRPQELTWVLRMLGVVGDRVELVVAHDDLGTSAVHHGPDDLENPQLPRSSVDEIADEHHTPLRVLVRAGTCVGRITELAEEPLQLRGAAVDVADDVVTQHT